MAKLSKRQQAARDKVNPEAQFPLVEAIKLVKDCATTKFDETVEMSINLNVDPRHADQNVRGMVSLPAGTGKNTRVAVFAKDAKADEAKSAGADIVGADDLAAKVQAGEIEFDTVIATPDMMPVVGKLGKILGPRGLMPNPKLGSVTNDVAQAIQDAKGGQIQFRVEKQGIVHAGVGKASFNEDQLRQNVLALWRAIQKAKPSGVKGSYVRRVGISSTMGPGVKLDIADLGAAAQAAE